jgi:hypothetical protein
MVDDKCFGRLGGDGVVPLSVDEPRGMKYTRFCGGDCGGLFEATAPRVSYNTIPTG